jgi:hypothetical protein
MNLLNQMQEYKPSSEGYPAEEINPSMKNVLMYRMSWKKNSKIFFKNKIDCRPRAAVLP